MVREDFDGDRFHLLLKSLMTRLLLVVLTLLVSDKDEEVSMQRAKISNSVERYE